MFTHAVLFEIDPSQVENYKRDCKIWARYAKKAAGFISYYTVKRIGYENQFASIYNWKEKKFHTAFMNKLHDWLVTKSKAKVKVLGYYNLSSIQETSVKTR